MPYIPENTTDAAALLQQMAQQFDIETLPEICLDPRAQILLFGKGNVSGGMFAVENDDRIESCILAGTERAARDLLSWFPFVKGLLLHMPQDWIALRARQQFDLEEVGNKSYQGARRKPKLIDGVLEFHTRVDSQKHPTVDRARALQTERGRDELGLYAAHGPLLLSRALTAKAPLEYVLYTPKLSSDPEAEILLAGMREQGIPHYLITEGLMRKCVDTAYVPTVLSILRKQLLTVENIYLGAKALVLVAESVEEAGNLGMILRTADAVAADAVMVCGTGSDPFAWKTVTGSRGSIFRVPLVYTKDTERLLKPLKEKGLLLISADLSGDRSHFELDYSSSTAFLVGNESEGLTSTALDLSDIRIRIPMPGEPDSLNVGVSAAVLLYEALRQRIQISGTG